MARQKRTPITVNCNADRYAAANERIIEFMDVETQKGGLISFRRMEDGTLCVDVYRCDPGITVYARPEPGQVVAVVS